MLCLGVREMCVALLNRNVATHVHRWDEVGERMELKEGWEIVIQVLVL